jgi:hypothetical protein
MVKEYGLADAVANRVARDNVATEEDFLKAVSERGALQV